MAHLIHCQNIFVKVTVNFLMLFHAVLVLQKLISTFREPFYLRIFPFPFKSLSDSVTSQNYFVKKKTASTLKVKNPALTKIINFIELLPNKGFSGIQQLFKTLP